LQEELNRPELRGEAAGAIRSLIEEIRLVPQNDRLEIELSGDLAGILAIAAGKKKPVSEGDGPPVTLVAGTRSSGASRLETSAPGVKLTGNF